MRKVKVFSAKMSVTNDDQRRSTFSETSQVSTQSTTAPSGERDVYMTPSLIRQTIREMKRPVNVRFLTLVKSAKQYSRNIKDPNDLVYLRRFMVTQLTTMLGEYVDMLQNNPSLQLGMYLKIQSVAPQAYDSAKVLSRVMILANKVRKSTGTLPPRNQRDLNRAMDNFISDVVNMSSNSLNPRNPLTNENLQK